MLSINTTTVWFKPWQRIGCLSSMIFLYQRTCCLLLRLILVFLVKRSKGLQSLLHAGPSLIKHLTAFVTKAIPQSLTVQDVQQASMRKIPTCDIDKEEKCSGKAPHRDQPSPCHQPQPLTPAPKLSQLSQAPADSRWVRIPRAPPGPEVLLVLLGVADYRGGAARKASAVAWWWWWTHSPPLLPGERWQLANTALYFSPKHPFQVVPGCKNVCSISIPAKCKYFQRLTFFTSNRGENYHLIKERGSILFCCCYPCRF